MYIQLAASTRRSLRRAADWRASSQPIPSASSSEIRWRAFAIAVSALPAVRLRTLK
jgi:hypothetical protein